MMPPVEGPGGMGPGIEAIPPEAALAEMEMPQGPQGDPGLSGLMAPAVEAPAPPLALPGEQFPRESLPGEGMGMGMPASEPPPITTPAEAVMASDQERGTDPNVMPAWLSGDDPPTAGMAEEPMMDSEAPMMGINTSDIDALYQPQVLPASEPMMEMGMGQPNGMPDAGMGMDTAAIDALYQPSILPSAEPMMADGPQASAAPMMDAPQGMDAASPDADPSSWEAFEDFYSRLQAPPEDDRSGWRRFFGPLWGDTGPDRESQSQLMQQFLDNEYGMGSARQYGDMQEAAAEIAARAAASEREALADPAMQALLNQQALRDNLQYLIEGQADLGVANITGESNIRVQELQNEVGMLNAQANQINSEVAAGRLSLDDARAAEEAINARMAQVNEFIAGARADAIARERNAQDFAAAQTGNILGADPDAVENLTQAGDTPFGEVLRQGLFGTLGGPDTLPLPGIMAPPDADPATAGLFGYDPAQYPPLPARFR